MPDLWAKPVYTPGCKIRKEQIAKGLQEKSAHKHENKGR